MNNELREKKRWKKLIAILFANEVELTAKGEIYAAYSLETRTPLEAALDIIQKQDNTITLSVVPRFKPYDVSDSANLAGMSRGHTIDFGIRSKIKVHDGGKLDIRLYKELTDKHRGTQIDLAYSRFFMNDAVPFSFSIGSKWYSSGLSKYDFGVYDNEAKAGRAAYNPGAVLTPYVGISSFYKFSDSLSLFGSMSSQFLPSKLTDSPIVKKTNKTTVAIGLSNLL